MEKKQKTYKESKRTFRQIERGLKMQIDYKNIMGDFFTRYREDVLKIDNTTTSYELLKTIIGNIDNVLKYDYDHCGFALNYYRIMIKCSTLLVVNY